MSKQFYINSADEEKLISLLQIYVQEWTPQNITVSMPVSWHGPEHTLGMVKLEFTTEDTILLSAHLDGVLMQQFVVQLQEVS